MRTFRWTALLLTILLAAVTGAQAGTMSIAWDAVSDPDLAGYRVYYGESPGNYTQNFDAGNTTSTVLTGLDACTFYYVAVKAYDGGGLESPDFSNELVGLPRPVVSSVSPVSGERGTSATLTITGESFDNGASVEFSGSGVTVAAVRRDSCNQLSVDVDIALGAPLGARDVTIVNPDNSYGTASAAFSVTDNAAPQVNSASPADGASDVAVSVNPSVRFSEPMDPASITANNVRLLDASGQAVAQSAGSPTLSGDGLTATITPAADLANDETFRVSVRGGSGGVRDADGVEMSSTWQQNPGFTTAVAADTQGPSVTGTSPANGATNVAVGTDPTVTFDEPVDAASVSSSSVQLLNAAGQPVAQAGNSPLVSADGLTVTIRPAADLDENSTYRIRVAGGAGGVTDEAGNPMAADYQQASGFTTENLPPGAVSNVRRTDVR